MKTGIKFGKMPVEKRIFSAPVGPNSDSKMTEWVSMRTTRRNGTIECRADSESEVTEESSVRSNVDVNTPEVDTEINAVKVEIKSEVEIPDHGNGSETDLSYEIPLETNVVPERPEDESVSGNNVSEVDGGNGKVRSDSREELSECVEEAEAVDVPFDEDEEEFIDASSEMPEVQIDTTLVLPDDITTANLEDVLPDVPDFQIEMPNFDSGTSQRQGTSQNNSMRRMRGNRPIEAPPEIRNNSGESADEEESVHTLSDVINENGGSEAPDGNPSQIGDIIASALGGIPGISIRNSSSGSSNGAEVVVIEEAEGKQKEESNDYNIQGRMYRRCCCIWEVVAQSAVRLYLHVQEKVRRMTPIAIPEMTIIQAWTGAAFATGTIPYYVGFNGEKARYELKSWVPQKLFCYLQHAFATAEAISSLHNISLILSETISPYTFIQLGGVIASCACSLLFTKGCLFDMNNLLEYENTIERKTSAPAIVENNPPVNTTAREKATPRSSRTTIFSILGFLLFLGFMTTSSAIIQFQAFDPDWKPSDTAVMLQTYSCHARETYEWKNRSSCGLDWFADEVSELPKEEILWGVFGMASVINSNVAEYQRQLIINSCNIAFFLDCWLAQTAMRKLDVPLIDIYDQLFIKTKQLSGFGGFLLLGELAEMAFRLPSWSFLIFRGDVIIRMHLLVLLLSFFTSVFLGCIGAWLSEMIRKEMSGPRGSSSLPSTTRATAIFFVHLYQNPVAIGIFGLVAVNFAFMVGYMGTVGSFVMMLYEIENDNCVKVT